MSKIIKLKNGNKLVNGQLYMPAIGRDPRRGKHIAEPAIAHGMSRQTEGTVHGYLHGQSINDEVADKLHLAGAAVPTHPGMTRAASGPSGSAVLKAGGQLGTEFDPDFDHSHVGHKIHKRATKAK